MFGPLYQSTVGGIVFQSMQRRHALWATMNAVTALALYGSLKALAHINAFFCRTHAPSFCLVELTLYMVMYIALSTLVYGVFTTDGSKFGGTGIRQQQWLKMMTMFCICSFVASFFAKAVLAALSVHIVSLGAMLNLSPQNLLPTLACVATLLSFVNSNTHSSLQGQPQPIVHSFGSAALYSVKNALPRSFSVAVTLSVIFAALRVAEATYFRLQCPSWAFSKTWAISSVLLCEGFNPELTPLPIFLPNTSLWLDAALAFVASAVLLFQTKLMMTSLAFVSTHPLNFQKLKAQLTQGEASSNRDNNEILMVQALLIGTISPSTASKSDTTGGALNRAANYFSNTAQAEAAAHAARQAALIQTVSHKTFEPSTLPYFGEGRSSNSVVKASIQNMSGSDKLSSVGKKVESFDLLARSLAFQDLQKVASCMPQRRAALFEKHWPQVITAALTMVDAAALQVRHGANVFLWAFFFLQTSI